jgi:ribosome-binding factor A
VAEVGVSIVTGEPRAVLAGLDKAASFLRGPLGRRLGLRTAPELRFHHDRSQELGSRLRDIVREDEERRREADTDGEPDDER